MVACAVLAAAATSESAAADNPELVNRASGTQGTVAGAGGSAISANGRYVAFTSTANDLSTEDADGTQDVFLRDRQTDTTVLVSRADGFNGAPGNNASRTIGGTISEDGRFVVFESEATNFGLPNPEGEQIYIRDLQAGTTELVSQSTDGQPADWNAYDPTISADGRFVAFVSVATNLASTPAGWNIFVRNLSAGTTTAISTPPAHDVSGEPSFAADGSFVAFASDSRPSLVDPPLFCLSTCIYVRNRLGGDTARVSGPGHLEDFTSVPSVTPSVSADGSKIAYLSQEPAPGLGDDDHSYDVFLHDLDDSTTTLVSRASGANGAKGSSPSFIGEDVGTYVSATGRYVAFTSAADNLSAEDNNSVTNVFVRDTQANTTTLVSRRGPDGPAANGSSRLAGISDDGRYVLYETSATNLSDDQGPGDDLYVYDTAGASPEPDTAKYVALGDSYSSGYGVGSYEPGTNKDAAAQYPENDCQRSAYAYGPLVADELDLPLVFKACQGAVTQDLFYPRTDPWGESAQFDHLSPDTGLVTLTIGGNDVGFASVLQDCITLLLPACGSSPSFTEQVNQALNRLDHQQPAPASIRPYNELFATVRDRTPFATRIAVGYPEFFADQGQSGVTLGRCNGVTLVDQRWAVQQIRRLNEVIERAANRRGFHFVDPSPYFDGHELCSAQEEWFFPALTALPPGLHPGRFHPTMAGQRAISKAVLDSLDRNGEPPASGEAYVLADGETVLDQLAVPAGASLLTVSTEWPGSDVVTTLISPSGDRFSRTNPGNASYHDYGPTWEEFEVADPEPGEWTIELYGADIPPGGERVDLVAQTYEPANRAPRAKIVSGQDGDLLVFDASGSTDEDGEIVSFEWYVTSANAESTGVGTSFALPSKATETRTVTLVVTDNDGSADFANAVIDPMSQEPSVVPLIAPPTGPTSQLGDRTAPSMTIRRLEVKANGRWRKARVIGAVRRVQARLKLRLSEDASIDVTLRLGKSHRWQRSRHLELRAGQQLLPLTKLLRGAKSGRYQLTFTLLDVAGNSRMYQLAFRIKSPK